MYKKIVAIVLVCCIVFVSPIHAFAESNEFLYRDSNFNKDKIVDIWSRGDHIEIYRTYIDDGSVLYKEYHNGDLVEQLIEKEEKDKFYNKIPEKTSRARLGTANLKIQHNSFNQIYEKNVLLIIPVHIHIKAFIN